MDLLDAFSIQEAQWTVHRWHRNRWPDRAGIRERIFRKLVAEVGELADALAPDEDNTSGRARGTVAEEAADVLTCLLALADEEGFDLAAAWRAKFSEVQAR